MEWLLLPVGLPARAGGGGAPTQSGVHFAEGGRRPALFPAHGRMVLFDERRGGGGEGEGVRGQRREVGGKGCPVEMLAADVPVGGHGRRQVVGGREAPGALEGESPAVADGGDGRLALPQVRPAGGDVTSLEGGVVRGRAGGIVFVTAGGVVGGRDLEQTRKLGQGLKKPLNSNQKVIKKFVVQQICKINWDNTDRRI